MSDPAAFAIAAHATPEGVVLEAVGTVDFKTASVFSSALRTAIDQMLAGPRGLALTVDLRGVDFIESSGLAALVDARKRLVAASHGLRVLLRAGEQPDRVLRMGGFDKIMTLDYPPGEAA